MTGHTYLITADGKYDRKTVIAAIEKYEIPQQSGTDLSEIIEMLPDLVKYHSIRPVYWPSIFKTMRRISEFLPEEVFNVTEKTGEGPDLTSYSWKNGIMHINYELKFDPDNKAPLAKSKTADEEELIGRIIDIFEDFLDTKRICSDQNSMVYRINVAQTPDEIGDTPVNLYGNDYDILREKIKSVLRKSAADMKEEN